jgi:hypothetical protein
MPAALIRRKKGEKTEEYTLPENLRRRGRRISDVQNFCGSRLDFRAGRFIKLENLVRNCTEK